MSIKNKEKNSIVENSKDETLIREMNSKELEYWRNEFLEHGVIVLKDFLLPLAFENIKKETNRMLDFAKRKDLQIESNGISERKMSTVGGNLIKSNSELLKGVYLNKELLNILAKITGERLYPVKDLNEDIVINCLHKKSDIHGRHIDTYSFAFNIMISSPPLNSGGELVIYSSGDKKLYTIESGSCYLIRTDKYEHEVLQLTQDTQRLVVNMSYANEGTLDLFSYSSSILYS